MQSNSDLKEITDSITNNGELIKRVVVRPAFKPKWWQFWLKPKPEESKEIYLTSATMNTMFRTVGVLSSLEVNMDEAIKTNASPFKAIVRNKDAVIKCLAIMIHNHPSAPPQWLIDCLDQQFAHEELMDLSARAYRRLGVENFFGITAYLNVTKVVSDTPETEARGGSLEESQNIGGQHQTT